MTEMLRDILTRLDRMNEKLDEGVTKMEDQLDNLKNESPAIAE